MKSLMISAAVIASIAIPGTVQAEDWYASVFAGTSFVPSIDTDYLGDDVEHEFDLGYTVGLTLGRRFTPNLRGEVELSYASYQGGDVLYDGSFSNTTDGTASATYLLANVWYDFNVVGGTRIRPYVGGGVGGVMLNTDTTFGGNNFGYGDTDFGFAYQAGLGVLYPLGRGSLDIGYRLKGASGMDIDDNDGVGVYESANYLSHTLQVGYMINF